ncbi:MAG TPA: helix-turn-helix transcriptional regulator [Dongiaceae bacterium]|nr:helix-turn-helix transcriptional regulator [Dongiaceae bacterium]
MANDGSLGTYLRDRRAKLDPTALGFPSMRRRTPGLRREEVAQRANVSATWYTWLEQGRGGAPSADVLDRIARALMLTEAEREHIFLLALGRPPEVRPRTTEGVTPRLQRVLDSLELCLGLVKNATWDIVAWNRAAATVLIDYAKLAPEQRNILRLLFCNPAVRAKMPNWESDVRAVVAAFRLETARAGVSERAKALVEELSQASPAFAAMWRDNAVSRHGEGVKRMKHPIAGPLTFDYSTFAVDGRPDLGLVIYTPATPADAERVRKLLKP